MTAERALRDEVHAAYLEFFELAERRRRWSVFSDIPWDELDEQKNDEQLAICAETFCGVEMYLPDYVRDGLNVLRDDFGQCWFHVNWGYEESKHALALRMYLERSGQRTADQLFDFERAVMRNAWRAPFRTPRQMTCYGAIQEAATWLIYQKQLACARAAGEPVLARVYQLIMRDEAAHAAFYQKVVKLSLVEDREGTLSDLAWVFGNFKMPGAGLVPDYDARIGVMRDAGIDRSVFLTRVWFPMLKKVGTDRRELLKYQRFHRENAPQAAVAK